MMYGQPLEPILSVLLRVNPGMKQIAQKDLYQDFHLSKTCEGFTFHLEKAYADANRVIIACTITKPANYKYDVPRLSPMLTTQQGEDLNRLGSSGVGNEKGQEGTDAFLFWFDAEKVVKNREVIDLHLQMQRFLISSYNLPQNSFPFDFSLPVHVARVVNTNQVVTVGGTAVTLQRVVVTPGETRVYLQGVGSNRTGPFVVGSLFVRANNADLNQLDTHTSWVTSDGLVVLCFEGSFFEEYGEWTLQVSLHLAERPVTRDSWIFHFVVP